MWGQFCLNLSSEARWQMPWDVSDVGFLAPDFVEFLAAFIAMMIAFAILVVLGQWWAR